MISYIQIYEIYLNELLKQDSQINVMLAKNWEEQDIIRWYFSEKLDGVRAYWNGINLISKNGNIFECPEWFTKDFPKYHLDGELYIGRNMFDVTSGIVRKKNSNEWHRIKYMIFDSPDEHDLVEKRFKRYTEFCKKYKKHCIPVKHNIIKSIEDLYKILAEIEKQKGEGIMAIKPHSKYENKRSNLLLKIKTFHDMEATVIGYVPGKDRFKNTTGSLICKLDNGIEFQLSGMDTETRLHPPAINSRIMFKYKEITKNGKPRFASYLRLYEKI